MDKVKRQVTALSRSRYARFGLVGIINTLVDFSIFNTLVIVFGFPIILANIFAATSGMIVSFILNKRTVFRDKGNSHTQAILFFATTLTGIWIIQNGVISLLYPLFDNLPTILKLNIVKVFAVMMGLLWNYAWYSQVVFNERRNEIPAKLLKYFESHWTKTVIAAVLVAIILGLFMGLGQSVWFDEGYSIILAQRPVHELVALTSVDAHPPLYYLYLKTWGMIFGWSELSLRLSSIIPSASAIAVVAVIIRRLFTARIALITLPFLVLAPFMVRYSYEIRMYPIVLFIGALGTYVLLRARTSHSVKPWLVYALIVAIGMYMLYMSIVIWIGHALWLLYSDYTQKKNPVTQKHWLYYGLAVVLFLPWLPIVINQLHNSALPPDSTQFNTTSLADIGTFLFAYKPAWGGDVITIVGSSILIALLTWMLILVRRSATKKQWQSLVLFIILFIAAIMFYWLISALPGSQPFTERYIVHVSVYLYALIGITVGLAYQLKYKRQALTLAAVALAMFVYGLYSLSTTGNYNFQRLQPTYGNNVRAAVDCDDTTVLTSGAYGYIDMWYSFQGCNFKYYQPVDLTYAGGFAPLNALNTTQRVKQVSDISSKKIAFIYYGDSTEFPKFDGSNYTLQKRLDYTGLHVLIYQSKS